MKKKLVSVVLTAAMTAHYLQDVEALPLTGRYIKE